MAFDNFVAKERILQQYESSLLFESQRSIPKHLNLQHIMAVFDNSM